MSASSELGRERHLGSCETDVRVLEVEWEWRVAGDAVERMVFEGEDGG